MTDCAKQPLLFPDLGARKVVADFSADDLSSDGGGLAETALSDARGVDNPPKTVCAHGTLGGGGN